MRPSRCPQPTLSTRPSALRQEAAELEELAEQGTYDWGYGSSYPAIARRRHWPSGLRADGLAVTRRSRTLLVGALTEQDAKELAARILEDARRLPRGARAGLRPTVTRSSSGSRAGSRPSRLRSFATRRASTSRARAD